MKLKIYFLLLLVFCFPSCNIWNRNELLGSYKFTQFWNGVSGLGNIVVRDGTYDLNVDVSERDDGYYLTYTLSANPPGRVALLTSKCSSTKRKKFIFTNHDSWENEIAGELSLVGTNYFLTLELLNKSESGSAVSGYYGNIPFHLVKISAQK